MQELDDLEVPLFTCDHACSIGERHFQIATQDGETRVLELVLGERGVW